VWARREGDIEAVFPKAKVALTPVGDYSEPTLSTGVATAVAKAAHAIDCGNFKDVVDDDDRHWTDPRVWELMFAWRNWHTPPPPRRSYCRWHRRLHGALSLP
jgi:hypothetical protein